MNYPMYATYNESVQFSDEQMQDPDAFQECVTQ